MGIRNANPDQMDQLADKLHAPGDGGAYGTLSGALGRARNLDVSAELASLVPLLSWLSDTAGQLRDKAALLRGETPALDFTPSSLADIRAIQEAANADPDAPFEVIGQENIDTFLTLAQKRDGELTDEEIQRMASLLGAFSDDPNFAAALVDHMGVEEFLALSQEIQDRAGEMDDPHDANRLREDMGQILAGAFWVPGNLKPGTEDYENWINGTPQGRAYAERLQAFQDSDHHGEAAQLINGLINSDDLSVTELEGLNEFLANQSSHPESVGFTRALMSEISPEGLIELAETLPERISGGEEDLRPGYAELQRNIANTLANATDVGKPAQSDPWYPHWAATPQAQWYNDFMAGLDEAGRSEIDVDFSDYEVRGYQLLIGLMENGGPHYSAGFLSDLSDNMIEAERNFDGDDGFWPIHYQDAAGVEGTDAEDLARFSLDPVNGVLGLMGRQPAVAAEYLDPHNGGDEVMDYLIGERDWESNYQMMMASRYGVSFMPLLPDDRTGFANALEAATTGRPAGSGENVPIERTAEGDRVMREVMERFTEDQGALIADDGDYAFMRPQLGLMGAAFMEDIQYTIGAEANLLHAPEEEHPDLFDFEGGQGHMRLGLFLSNVGRDPEAYAALSGAQQAYTALAVDAAMNVHTGSGADIGTQVDIALGPGAVISGVLADARADAVFNAGIAEDKEFNRNLDMAETAANLVLSEGLGKLTERIPVGGEVISWGVDELQSSIFDSFKRDSSDEARSEANDEYWAAREAFEDTARDAIDLAGEEYEPRQPDENVTQTLNDLKNIVGDTLNENWDEKYYWTEPPEEKEEEN